MSTNLTSKQLEHLLGEVDPLIIHRILETRATLHEVEEALAEVEDERESGRHHEPTSPRVAAVREIIEDVLEDEDPIVLGYD